MHRQMINLILIVGIVFSSVLLVRVPVRIASLKTNWVMLQSSRLPTLIVCTLGNWESTVSSAILLRRVANMLGFPPPMSA